MRLVDADNLLDILDAMIVGHKSASDVYDVVDSMPTVDPVKHGHWKEHKDYPGLAYLCSDCGYFTTDRSYYCPNCGAHMEVEDETD